MAVRIFQTITKYQATATCTQPLHIGSAMGDKEEVLIHPTDGLPFIQAASIAGVFREYYRQKHSEAQVNELFGASTGIERGSRICFSDGSFLGDKPVLELRPRVRLNPATGTCDASTVKGTEKTAGHKFNMEYIGAGAEFSFSMYLYDGSRQEELESILAALHQEQMQLGGLKSSGCGFIRLKELKRKVFTMADAKDRKQWAIEDELPQEAYTDILPSIKKAMQKERNQDIRQAEAYEIRVMGHTEGSLLVKSIAVPDCGEGAPDCMNIQNARKDYIVPGSSFKGAVRNQMEKIAAYLGRPEIISDTFGYTGDSHTDGRAGNIVFYDTAVGDREENDRMELTHRIHIDKFTGGVMDGGLFQEKNAAGSVEFHISVRDRNHPDSTCGLLLLALRDLAIGVMSVGGGYNVGKGIITVRKIVVKDHRHGTQAELSFGEGRGITGEETLITECIKAAQAKEDIA